MSRQGDTTNPGGSDHADAPLHGQAGLYGIRATVEWIFKASQPPGDHPFGAYFTTLGPGTKNLALRLRIPREKLEFVFVFADVGDLLRLRGQRGDFILYSSADYVVEESRKIDSGEAPVVEAGLTTERDQR